jgi:hypothetical protein
MVCLGKVGELPVLGASMRRMASLLCLPVLDGGQKPTPSPTTPYNIWYPKRTEIMASLVALAEHIRAFSGSLLAQYMDREP